MPKVMGKAMKFRKVTCTRARPAPPIISSTPRPSVVSAISAAAAGRIVNAMITSTAISEATVAIGPSWRIDLIIAPNTTAKPEVSITLPLSRRMVCSTLAMRSNSRPFHTDSPFSGG